jgi:competence protein ComEC
LLGWLAGATALGIALADTSGAAPALAWLVVCAAGFLGLRLQRRGLVALLLAVSAGFYGQASRLWEASEAMEAPPRERTVEGVVSRRSAASNPRWIDLEDVRGAGARRLRVFGNDPSDLDPWLPGDRLRARLRIAPLRRARNPGAEGVHRRAMRSGLGATATLVHPTLVIAEGIQGGAAGSLHATRRRIARRLEAAGPGSDLLRGLALGDREAIPEARRDAFVRLGLAHALAVSGLHLAWVVAATYAIARSGLARCTMLASRCDTRRLALWPAAALGLGYAGLAGWGVPVQRALLLLFAAALAMARRRPGLAGAALGAAALWILAREPHALFDAGAQLSFGAVAAFLWARRSGSTASHGGSRAESIRSAIEDALRRSATAIVATAPLLAWHGGGVSIVALVANLVALPWLGGVVLPIALCSATAAAFDLPGIDAALRAAAGVADASGRLLEAVAAGLPSLDRSRPGGWLVVASVGLAAAGLACRGTASRAAVALCLAVLLMVAPAAPFDPAPPRLVVLDVGQGDAALVQGLTGVVLVDGGGAWQGWDTGRRRVLPALRALGVTRLDLVIASHADLDHRGGLPAVLRALPVAELWLPWGGAGDPDFAELRSAAERAGTVVREVGRGSPQRRIGALRVDPLWPPRVGSGSRNGRSLVVRVGISGGHRVLFPGDLDADAEARLVGLASDLTAELLLLPHHGSRTSSSEAFLEAVSPRLAIASAPCRSRFGMPHPEVRLRVARRAIPLGWTGRDGALVAPLRGALRVVGSGEPVPCP